MLSAISVDDHLVEPASLWTSRLPKRYKDVGPNLVDGEQGETWVLEGNQHFILNNELVAGRPSEEWGAEERPIRHSDMLQGYFDPVARAEVLMRDGIVGSICFPTIARFAGTLFLEAKDKTLGSLCVSAYNDFVLDEWCTQVKDFYIPMTITQVWDPDAAAAEILRCAERGHVAYRWLKTQYRLDFPPFTAIIGTPCGRLCPRQDCPCACTLVLADSCHCLHPMPPTRLR